MVSVLTISIILTISVCLLIHGVIIIILTKELNKMKEYTKRLRKYYHMDEGE